MYRPFTQNAQVIIKPQTDILSEGAEVKILKISEWLEFHKQYKDREMLYLVMYDIENNKIRTQIAKYLIKKGCLRIQKSVYLSKSNRTTYEEIGTILREINVMYDNKDSILILPVPEDKFNHLKMIGQNIEFEIVTKPKNVLII